MTDADINKTIAEITGANKLVGLKKRGMWWRPNAHGYTYNESEAWRITEEEAKKYARPNDFDSVTIERFKTIDYCNDLNACHEFEMIESILKGEAYNNMLDFLTLQQGVLIWNASARTRCEALLRVNGKWVDV